MVYVILQTNKARLNQILCCSTSADESIINSITVQMCKINYSLKSLKLVVVDIFHTQVSRTINSCPSN